MKKLVFKMSIVGALLMSTATVDAMQGGKMGHSAGEPIQHQRKTSVDRGAGATKTFTCPSVEKVNEMQEKHHAESHSNLSKTVPGSFYGVVMNVTTIQTHGQIVECIYQTVNSDVGTMFGIPESADGEKLDTKKYSNCSVNAKFKSNKGASRDIGMRTGESPGKSNIYRSDNQHDLIITCKGK